MPATRRVAVIGAGPSGLYATAALLDSDVPVEVDVLDRLPAPFGLVRYGVAPDHVRMKSVISVLRKPFVDGSRARFLGNVRVGEGGIELDRLREHYDAVVHAAGSSVERDLGIEGEELDGSHGSRAFVSWYSGHPDAVALDPRLEHHAAVVVGAGNVALDVARVLARCSEEMAQTDVPDPVLEVLRASRITDVHILIRRGPEHAKFTGPELRQIGRLDGVQVRVHDDGALAAAPSVEDRRVTQNLKLLNGWEAADDPVDPPARRIHLHFLRTPLRVEGLEDRVSAVVVGRNAVVDGRVVATGEEERIEAGLLVRAIGYAGEPVPGLPHDEDAGIVPNAAGRVLDGDLPVPGAYVTGWLKRGPTGVIGTNKGDAAETVACLVEDLDGLPAASRPDPETVLGALRERGIDVVVWEDWEQLDREEVRLGRARGCDRVKVAELESMLAACQTTAVRA